ncbi:MAG: biotin-independent malonate decarboxylase subunit beta [Candidatus Obscuribacterales bacterium]|nr:biotin-independent malonate decarboxylase subunit beta [Candidatus Obscuribacterales bacterium]
MSASKEALSAPTKLERRESFIELNGRERAIAIFGKDAWRELLGPFDRIESPWLMPQNITAQADDGCIVLKGKIDGISTVVISMEAAFQGGSLGEVSGAKICAALDLACRDNQNGVKTCAVLLLETGGVRLPEANLGLAAVAEIVASLIALREHAPVICLSAGTVGCFGGMSLVAALSSYMIMTPEGRLGLNGPEVIEQEHGIEEFDSRDRALIWAIDGGEQRYYTGLVDALVKDDVGEIRESVRKYLKAGVPKLHRSSQIESFKKKIAALNTEKQWDPADFRKAWHRENPNENN